MADKQFDKFNQNPGLAKRDFLGMDAIIRPSVPLDNLKLEIAAVKGMAQVLMQKFHDQEVLGKLEITEVTVDGAADAVTDDGGYTEQTATDLESTDILLGARRMVKRQRRPLTAEIMTVMNGLTKMMETQEKLDELHAKDVTPQDEQYL